MESGVDPNRILALAALLAGVFAACGLLFLLAQLFSRFTRLRLQSLSLDDLLVLARSPDDRTDVIKEFYDWQHKLLLAVIGFIAANVVLDTRGATAAPDGWCPSSAHFEIVRSRFETELITLVGLWKSSSLTIPLRTVPAMGWAR
jgi:hypothetical protein